MTATTVFIKDERTENWLRSLGVSFSGPVAIKLTDIDRKASRHNQARAEAILPEAVESYRQALRNGDQMPALVVHKVGNKYNIIDGNNRDQAAVEEKVLKEYAYVIDPRTPSETIALLTVSANALNGVRSDKSWSLTNALWLVDTGYTREAAAKAMKVSVSAITAHEKERDAGKRAHTLRVSGWETANVRVRQIIGRIKLDKPFVIVAEAAIAAHISYTPEFAQLIVNINAARDQDEAIQIATIWARATMEHAKQNARMGRKRGTENHKLSLLTGLGKVSAFNLGTFNATFTTDEDRKIINERIQTALAKLVEMSYRLNGKDETEELVLDIVGDLGDKE